jgi:hypothetical protein
MPIPATTLPEILLATEVEARDARQLVVVGALGDRTLVQAPGCSTTFAAADLTSKAPGERVVSVAPRGTNGRRIPGSDVILPVRALAGRGASLFPPTPDEEAAVPLLLVAAEPEEIPAGATTSTRFVGFGFQEEPLTIIEATVEHDPEIPDPEIVVENAAWEPDVSGLQPGAVAIRADVVVPEGVEPGRRIFYVARRGTW